MTTPTPTEPTTALSPSELGRMRELDRLFPRPPRGCMCDAQLDRRLLLAEVDRLRAERPQATVVLPDWTVGEAVEFMQRTGLADKAITAALAPNPPANKAGTPASTTPPDAAQERGE